MIERKPPRSKIQATSALEAGAELYPIFRKNVPLEGKLTSVTVSLVAAEAGLSERQVRRLVARFRDNPVASSLAPAPRGPKIGSHRISAPVRDAIEHLMCEVFLVKPPPSASLAARDIQGLLTATNGDYRFAPEDVPSQRTLLRLIEEISEPQRARTSMGSKERSAHEPHPGPMSVPAFWTWSRWIIPAPM